MPSIDERVVQMTFRNADFMKGANDTVAALDRLNKSLQMSGVAENVSKISSRFSALGAIGFSVINTLTNSVMQLGGKLLNNLLDPLIQGGKQRALNIEQAKFMFQGLGMNIEKTMASALAAVKGTSYGLDEAAKTAAQFGASGMRAGADMTKALRAISGVAAMTGSSYSDISNIFTKVAGNGRLMGDDLLMMSARGLNAAAVLAKSMHISEASVREMVTQGKISFKEFYTAMDDAFGKHALDANKTYAGALANVHAALARIGADFATPWFRGQRDIFNALIPVIDGVHAALTPLIKTFTQIMGINAGNMVNFLKGIDLTALTKSMQPIADSVMNIFRAIGSVIAPIKQAFTDIFPAPTVQQIVNIANAIRDFTAKLTLSATASEHLRQVFDGVFSAIRIVGDVIAGIIGVFARMAGASTGAGGGILALAAKLGEFITHVKNAIESGTAFNRFFQILGTVMSAPLKALSALASGIGTFVSWLGRAMDAMRPFFQWVANAFSGLMTQIGAAIKSGNVSAVLGILNQVLFGAILLAVRRFMQNLTQSTGGAGFLRAITAPIYKLTFALKSLQINLNAGTIQKIAIAVGVLAISLLLLSRINPGRLATALTAMTVSFGELLGALAIVAKVSTGVGIVKMAAIAAALNLLATAMVTLSVAVAILAQFSWSQLARGISAIAAMMAILVVSVNLLSKNTPGVVSASAAMILMAIALNIMAGAVAMLGNMDWSTLGKGVGTIAALMLVMGLFNRLGGTQLISTAAALLILSAALNVMALAMQQLASMSWGNLAKGIVGLAGGLLVIALAMSLMPKDMLLTATGLLIVSAALFILSNALSNMGTMSWGEIAKSLITLAGALVIIAAAMMLMSGALPGAAALLVIAAALTLFVPVMTALGSLSWGTILTALGALAGIFLILGAAGLLLGPLVPVLLGLGVALTLFGLAVLAVGAGVALLGIGLTAIGVAVTVSGAAILAFVQGLLGLIPQALAAIGQGIVAFAAAIATGGVAITNAFVTILTAILTAVIKLTPMIGQALDGLIGQFLRIMNKYAPQVINLMVNLLMSLLSAIASHMGQFVQKGADIVVSFFNGIAANLGRMITAATNVAVAFINGIGANMGRIVQAGANLVINFINSVANTIRASGPQLGAAAWNLASAIVDGLVGGLAAFGGRAIAAAQNIASGILGAIGRFLGFGSPAKELIPIGMSIVEGMIVGIQNKLPSASAASAQAGQAVIDAMSMATELAQSAVDFNPKITPVIDLSLARKGFDDLAAMANSQLTTSASASAASSIGPPELRPVYMPDLVLQGGSVITFNQTNTSPKALSEAEIYRQTKNQISTMKGALPV